MGTLLNSFKITNLDLENENPTGFVNKTDTVTRYRSPFITGTPTTTSSPGPVKAFVQVFSPSNQYLNLKIDRLISTTANTNFDVESSTPNGGIPYKQDKDPTRYPATVTGTPTTSANPGPTSKFNQSYTPTNTYLSINPVRSTGNLKSTVANTDLDVESSTPNGGIPYKIDKDPTVYSKYNTGTPTKSGPGAPAKFNQIFSPSNEYISVVKDEKLKLSVDSTNFDIENSTPNGGIPYKIDKDPTRYPAIITGTPTNSSNPGIPSKFNQIYTPVSTYLSVNPIKGTGKLKSTVANTNLDVEDGKPNGGIPYKVDKDPTSYPSLVTGTPTTSPIPPAPNKFNQVYIPTNTYLSVNPIKGTGNLKFTVANTDFDVESPTPNGGIPYKIDKDPTTYSEYNTGTPSTSANPNGWEKFIHLYYPKKGDRYLDKNPIKGEGILGKTLDITNFDVEKEGVDGGIPYKQDKDPTIYPILTKKSTSVRGYFATSGKPAEKFNQIYTPRKGETYLDFIEPYSAPGITVGAVVPGTGVRPRRGLRIIP
jgi:hypothetical protein